MILLAIVGRPAARDGPARAAAPVHRAPRRGGAPPHPIRAAQGRRARAHLARLPASPSITSTRSSRSFADPPAAPTPAKTCTSSSPIRASRVPSAARPAASTASSSTARNTASCARAERGRASATSRSTPSSNCNCTASRGSRSTKSSRNSPQIRERIAELAKFSPARRSSRPSSSPSCAKS